MKKLLASILVVAVMCNGCYVSQHDKIDRSYKDGWSAVNMQCKNNMNEYCKEQYRHLNNVREHDLAQDKELDAKSDRTAIVAAVIVVSAIVVVGGSIGITCINAKTCAK